MNASYKLSIRKNTKFWDCSYREYDNTPRHHPLVVLFSSYSPITDNTEIVFTLVTGHKIVVECKDIVWIDDKPEPTNPVEQYFS